MTLGLKGNGKVRRIFETINAVHILMDAQEAQRLSQDKRVKSVEQDVLFSFATQQFTPGWGLDRIDQTTTALNNTYNYINTGAGRTIYVLDSGLALSNSNVANTEFGGRASIYYDFTYNRGALCGPVSIGASETIVNMSLVLHDNFCNTLPASTRIQPAWESAVIAAYKAGIIVVAAAGNDSCNTANYSPTRIPEAFVVGATSNVYFSSGKDARAWWGYNSTQGHITSRTGTNISTFAPSFNVTYRNKDGYIYTNGIGTSLATAYVSGTFAVACQSGGSFCNTATTSTIYQMIRNNTVNTATDINGSAFTDGTTSRFIQQKW